MALLKAARALDIGTSTALFAHREQHFDHFLGVVHLFKFGNNVSRRLMTSSVRLELTQ